MRGSGFADIDAALLLGGLTAALLSGGLADERAHCGPYVDCRGSRFGADGFRR
ncbi:hypothetical protein AB0K38_18030 [Streptomyces griseoincarnatus]|uniref:hypothetical protein n=1 Tax=Streptomyces tunisiensis TaxID=948699 RepID=UPI00348DF629